MAGIGLSGRVAIAAWAVAACAPCARAAESVVMQCGREYQAARSAGTLNGMDWNAYRVACAERRKALPASAGAGPPAPVPAALAAAPAPEPAAPAAAAEPGPGAGAAAMRARQRTCGAEWTAQKASLVAATPSLTWPKYWSRCNSRIKATGR